MKQVFNAKQEENTTSVLLLPFSSFWLNTRLSLVDSRERIRTDVLVLFASFAQLTATIFFCDHRYVFFCCLQQEILTTTKDLENSTPYIA